MLKEYQIYYNNDVLIRKHITEEDLNKSKKIANMGDVYQYQTLKILLDTSEEILAFAAYLEKTPEWSDMSKEERKFIQSIAANKEELPEKMAALDLIEDSDFDRMVQLNYDQLMVKNKKIIEGQRQYIRYPKLST